MFRKIKLIIKKEISKGLTPIKLTQSLVSGLLIGCFPILGCTSILAFFVGSFLKLNHAVVQAANYLMYPIQLLLIPVYIKIIAYTLSMKDVPIRPDLIIKLFVKDPRAFMSKFFLIGIGEVLLWMAVSSILYFVLMKFLSPIVLSFREKE